MTKRELIEKLKGFSDDIEIAIEEEGNTGATYDFSDFTVEYVPQTESRGLDFKRRATASAYIRLTTIAGG